MEKKTIELEVKSNVGESISDLKALKRQLKDTAAGSEDFKKLYNQIDDLEDKIKSSKNASSDWVDSLESAGGPLGMVGASLNKAKVATQSFGGALKATGIGLFVSLIGGLVAAFQDNENAMKKIQPLLDGLSKVFNGIFRAVEPLFNTLVDLAISALPTVSKAFGVVYSSVTSVFQSLGMLGGAIKKLISGDFSGAWKDAKSSVTDFSKNYDASIKRFNDGTKEMSKTEKEESDKRAENRKKALEKQREEDQKSKDKALADKKAYLDKANAFDEENNLKAVDTEKIKRDNAILAMQNDLTNKVAIGQNWVAEHKRMTEQEVIDAKAASDAKLEFEKNRDLAIATSKQNLTNIVSGLEASGLAKTKAGQIISKAIALTQIGIDSAVAMSKASTLAAQEGVALQAAFPMVPGLGLVGKVLSYASTAAMVVGNIGRAKQLLSGSVGGSAPNIGGSSTPSGGGAAPAAPAFNVVGASATNQLAQTIGNKEQQPVKAYVVSNDVTTAQSLDRNIIQSASIG
jgi:hypothetical protein